MSSVQHILHHLQQFISYPSISSDKHKKEQIAACAKWLKDHLLSVGMHHAQIFETSAHPVVYAGYKVQAFLPTILFYGHYDVQPVDPLNKWETSPFNATIKGDYMYGRGASDDKGQLFIHIKAVEDLIKKTGSLPVNVKFLIEGSEEIGSAGLNEFILKHAQMLQCDAVVVSDTKMLSEDIPAITYSLRGALNAEIAVQTSAKDLHSGTFGGCIPNAVNILSSLLSSLHNNDNSIAIKDFYKGVITISNEERNFMRSNGPSDSNILRDAATHIAWGEKGYSLYERTTIRPSLAVTGVSGGYQGEGVKNVIPSTALAKLNFRLVTGQKPGTVQALLNRHIKEKIPEGIAFTIKYSSQANPVSFTRNNRYIIAACKAYEKVFKVTPHLIRSGGTIPAVDHLHNILKAPVVLMGFAQASDNMHAPNEKFYLPNLFRGIETSAWFIKNVAALHQQTAFTKAAFLNNKS